ncbi:ligand-binding sensor domain-containing protein [Hymenobacter ruber]
MKKYFPQTKYFAFLAILFWGSACKGLSEKELPKEKVSESNRLAVQHPRLIKTIGNPRYGNVQCILQDKAGNLWFGTTENGLYKYDGKSFHQFLVTDGLTSNNVYSLLEDKEGQIWIGTEAGLCRYDGKRFATIQIPLPKNLPPNTNPYYRNSHRVSSMLQAKNGNLWFVTIDGIYVYDGKSFTPFILTGAHGIWTDNDKAELIFEDKAGNIWFGGRSNKGVYRYDGKSVTNLKLKELYQNGPKPKAHSWAWPQLQDKSGNIWFSNWGGVYRYDGKLITSFTKKDGLSGNMVTRIIEDKKGNLWFGGDGGLSRYDGKTFTRFSTNDGLPNLGVWSILEDTSGKLWVGTRETGLYLYDGKTFINYSEYKH